MTKLMKIDSFTTAALADEFRLKIMGGRVQKIVQISADAFGFEIYSQGQRHYLCISADPQAPGAYLLSYKTRRGVGNETPLQQLFQKYLRNSVLMTIEQPDLERVLLFHFSGKAGPSTMVLEMLGTRTNLIFLDERDQILALARPSAPQKEGHRPLLAGHRYGLPEPQKKLTVTSLTVDVLIDVADRAPQDNLLSRTLVTRIAGLSPLIAREIVFRAYGMADLQVGQVDDPARLLPVIQQVYGHINRHEWKPYVTFDKNAQVEYFAPIALTHLPQSEPVESISMAVEAHFSAAANEGETDAYQAARFPVQLAIEQALNRLERRNKKLDQDEASLEDPEIYKQKGEATLSYSYQVKPRQTSLEVIWTDEETLVIELDPSLSASQNAQRYFDRYQKAKRAAEIIPRQRKRIALQQEYLNQLSLDLEMAETRPEIDAVAVSLQSAGFDKDFRKKNDKKATKKAAPAASQPRRFISPDGFTVWVGRNATQNHDLTFGRARPEDIWLHARGVPGSHVVIVAPDERPPKSTIEWAAGIAAYYSKAKKAGRAIVSYTRKKYVRPIKGAPPGLVRVHNESTIRVAPFKPDEA